MARPPSVGELAKSVGVLFESALEGGGDGGVGEAGGSVWCGRRRGGLAAFAFAAVAAFFGFTAFLDPSGAGLFGAGLLLFGGFWGFAALDRFFTAGFADFADFAGFDGFDGFAALDGFAAGFFAAGFLGR